MSSLPVSAKWSSKIWGDTRHVEITRREITSESHVRSDFAYARLKSAWTEDRGKILKD